MAGMQYAKDGDTKTIKCPHCKDFITYKVKITDGCAGRATEVQLTFYSHKPTDKKRMEAKMEAS